MRKLTSLLLALLMLALPLSGLAASPNELVQQAVNQGRAKTVNISLTPGTLPLDASISTAISDLLAAMDFTCTTYQKDDAFQTDVVLSLSGKDALTFSAAGQENSFYLASSLLGDSVAAFTEDEGITILERITTILGQVGGVAKEQLDEMKAQIAAGIAAGASTMPTADDMNLTAMIDFVSQLMSRVEYTDVTAQPKNCDAATKMGTLTITADDIAELYATLGGILKQDKTLMDTMSQMGSFTLNNGDKSMTFEELLDAAPEAIRESLENYEDSVLTLYMDENEEPVFMTFALKSKPDAEDHESIDIEYTRLTTADGIGHAINMTAVEDDETVGITASVLTGSDTLDICTLNAVSSEDGRDDVNVFSLTYQNAKDRTDTTAHDQMTLDLAVTPGATSAATLSARLTADVQAAFDGKDATKEVTASLYLGGMEDALITVNGHVATGDAPASIVTDRALRPGQMTEDEFNTYASEVIQSVQLNLVSLLQSLPASVLNLFIGTK